MYNPEIVKCIPRSTYSPLVPKHDTFMLLTVHPWPGLQDWLLGTLNKSIPDRRQGHMSRIPWERTRFSVWLNTKDLRENLSKTIETHSNPLHSKRWNWNMNWNFETFVDFRIIPECHIGSISKMWWKVGPLSGLNTSKYTDFKLKNINILIRNWK